MGSHGSGFMEFFLHTWIVKGGRHHGKGRLPLKVTIGTMEKIITSIHQHDTILENTLPLVLGTGDLLQSEVY